LPQTSHKLYFITLFQIVFNIIAILARILNKYDIKELEIIFQQKKGGKIAMSLERGKDTAINEFRSCRKKILVICEGFFLPGR